MIINTGNRTDIPAFFSEWFYNRIKEQIVMARNPYFYQQVIQYRLSPEVVDILCFCTKNPEPMLSRLDEIKDYRQFWFVTVTPYGKDIEPYVPEKEKVMESMLLLSEKIGANSLGWRYDPIFINETYTLDFHIRTFEAMCQKLSGSVSQCVISFIDLYEKTKRNFKSVREVKKEEQDILTREFAQIGQKYKIPIRMCCENMELEKWGVDISGCMTQEVLEKAIGLKLNVPKGKQSSRPSCNCLLGNDIGAYNTCAHGCLYCYANYDRKSVVENLKRHDPKSPLLIGHVTESDHITIAKQSSYCDGQLRLF